MKKDISFINQEDRDVFCFKDRIVHRSIIQIYDIDRKKALTEPALINNYVTNQISNIIKSEKKWFSCLNILVRENDGMSWSLQSLYMKLKDNFPNFHFVPIRNIHNVSSSPHMIAEIIGFRKFWKCCRKSKIDKKHWLKDPHYIKFLLILGLFMLFLYHAFYFLSFTGGETISQNIQRIFLDPQFSIFMLAYAIIGALSQFIITKIQHLSKTELNNTLNNNTILQNTEILQPLLQMLAHNLQKKFYPRIVLIDNYSLLDPLTKLVIDYYFRHNTAQSLGSEYWIIFNVDNDPSFHLYFQRSLEVGGYSKVKFFKQIELTKTEKDHLINKFNFPLENSEYTSIKHICSRQKDKFSAISTFFSDNKQKFISYNENYSLLNLLFLFSVNSSFGNNYLQFSLIIETFTKRNILRNEVLKSILYGTKFSREEYDNVLKLMSKEFSQYLLLNTEGKDNSFRVMYEVFHVLSDMTNVLELPHPSLIHCFWCIFWFDIVRNQVINAFWIKKISHHLLESDISKIQSCSLHEKIQDLFFDILLFCLRGSIKTCFYEDVSKLVSKGINYCLDNSSLDNSRLTKTIIELFIYTGNPTFLDSVLLLKQNSELTQNVSDSEPTLLDNLYFNLILSQRENLNYKMFFFSENKINENLSILQYTRTYISWILLNLFLSSSLPESKSALKMHIDSAIDNHLSTFSSILSKACEDYAQNVTVLDIMTLIFKIWTHVILLQHFNYQLCATTSFVEIDTKELLNYLLESVETLILLASEIKHRLVTKESSSSSDLMTDSIVQNLVAISVASCVVTAQSTLRRYNDEVYSSNVVASLNGIINVARTSIDMNIPLISSFDDLFSNKLCRIIEKLLHLCSILWFKIGLDNLCDHLTIIRSQFNIYSRQQLSCFLEQPKTNLSVVCEHLQGARYLKAVYFNILSMEYNNIAELSVHFKMRSFELIINSSIDLTIRQEISAIAIEYCHAHTDNLQPFVKLIFLDEDFFTDYLNSHCDNELPALLLCYTNAILKCKDVDIFDKFVVIVEKHLSLMSDQDVIDEIFIHLEFTKIEFGCTTKNIHEICTFFDSRPKLKKSHLYARLMILLVRENSLDKERLCECLELFDRNPGQDQFNTYFLLSIIYLEHYLHLDIADPQLYVSPLEYLRGSIIRWETQSDIEVIIRAYTVLYELDQTNTPLYQSKHLQWCQLKIDRDHVIRYPDLISKGLYFRVFSEYFESMHFWGLQSDDSKESLYKQTHLSSEEKVEFLKSYLSNQRTLPEAFVNNSAHPNSQFIVLGSVLFSPEILANNNYDDLRSKINVRAKKSLPTLVNIILNLPALPDSIKRIISAFHRRFDYIEFSPDAGNLIDLK